MQNFSPDKQHVYYRSKLSRGYHFEPRFIYEQQGLGDKENKEST